MMNLENMRTETPATKGHILCSIYTGCPEWANAWRQKVKINGCQGGCQPPYNEEDIPPTTKNDPVQNVSTAEAEKLFEVESVKQEKITNQVKVHYYHFGTQYSKFLRALILHAF